MLLLLCPPVLAPKFPPEPAANQTAYVNHTRCLRERPWISQPGPKKTKKVQNEIPGANWIILFCLGRAPARDRVFQQFAWCWRPGAGPKKGHFTSISGHFCPVFWGRPGPPSTGNFAPARGPDPGPAGRARGLAPGPGPAPGVYLGPGPGPGPGPRYTPGTPAYLGPFWGPIKRFYPC